jgi:hypothetical protein
VDIPPSYLNTIHMMKHGIRNVLGPVRNRSFKKKGQV